MRNWSRDAMMGFGAVALVGVLLAPLPPVVLALLQTANLATALVVLLATIYARDVLEMSVFPSLLLATTLFRLTLNVAATRMILLKGNAGQVIAAFGHFLMGSDPIVGFVTFVILIIVQFVVITKGSERVAEVAARFTLDAMPGKQMSIDADLNAGLIRDTEAKERRRTIEQEADFYGAMDGASKFVRGDAIAGILIVAANMVGGFLIGYFGHHLTAGQALHQYALLAVGDGLVTQVPALLLSVAAGVMVTRSGDADNITIAIREQVLGNTRVVFAVGTSLLVLGVIPGLPHIPFIVLGLALCGWTWYSDRVDRRRAARVAIEQAAARQEERKRVEVVVEEPPLLCLRYGVSLGTIVSGALPSRIRMARSNVAKQLGLLLPDPVIDLDPGLGPQDYAVDIRGVEVATGSVRIGQLLILAQSPDAEKIPGVEVLDPAFGVPATWIPQTDRKRAASAGYAVVEPADVLATHFQEVCAQRAGDLLDRAGCKTLLEQVRQRSPGLVDDLVPKTIAIWQVQRVLQGLLAERVSIRNLSRILESISEVAAGDIGAVVEHVRRALAPEITRDARTMALDDEGRLRVIIPAPALEELMARVAAGEQVPGFFTGLRANLASAITNAMSQGAAAVVLTHPSVRVLMGQVVHKVWPKIMVVSTDELMGNVQTVVASQILMPVTPVGEAV